MSDAADRLLDKLKEFADSLDDERAGPLARRLRKALLCRLELGCLAEPAPCAMQDHLRIGACSPQRNRYLSRTEPEVHGERQGCRVTLRQSCEPGLQTAGQLT